MSSTLPTHLWPLHNAIHKDCGAYVGIVGHTAKQICPMSSFVHFLHGKLSYRAEGAPKETWW